MKNITQLLDNNFLEVNLKGTSFIDFKKFYNQYNKYQGYSTKQKKQIKLFLYSAYYIDKYVFEVTDKEKKVKIINQNTSKAIYFDLKRYLTQLFSIDLNENDYSISIDENSKELSVGCLSKLRYAIEGVIYNAYLLLNEILAENEVKDKELQKWSSVIDTSDKNFLQNINIRKFYDDILWRYLQITDEQWRNIDKEVMISLSRICSILMYCEITQDNQIKIPNFHIWDILMNTKYAAYLSSSCPIALEVKYIGQAFGKNGSRTVYDRIGKGHEHIQKLAVTCPENKELALNFFSLQPKSEMIGQVKDPRLKEFYKKIIENRSDDVTPSQYVNLAELGLITFFKPSDNIDLKKRNFSAPNEDLKTINEINAKYSGIIISMYLNYDNIKIYSEERPLSKAFIPTKSIIQYKFDSNLSSLISEIKQYEEI